MMKRPHPRPTLQHPVSPHLQTFSMLQFIFNTKLVRFCFYISAADRGSWTVLFSSTQYVHPPALDMYFGKTEPRDAYLRQNFDRLSREKMPLVSRYGDYVDVFAPYLVNGRCDGYLYSGPVLETCPTPGMLRRHWKHWTGVEGSETDPDFLRYVRVALNTPVLDPQGLEGYRQLMQILARWLAGEQDSRLYDELNRLRVEVFSPRIPHPYWVDWAIGTDPFFSKPEKEVDLDPWVAEEVRIRRMPTVVAALMPLKSAGHGGNLDFLCLARHFQHECFLSAQDLEESTSRPLGDYGAIVLTSAKPGLPPAMARLEVEEKIRGLCDSLGRHLNTRIIAGIGTHFPGGGDLARSYHEAVTSLHSAVQSGKSLVPIRNISLTRTTATSLEMREAMKRISESISLSSPAKLLLARERFTQQLVQAGYSVEASRAHLVSVLNLLMDKFDWRSGLAPRLANALTKEWYGRLDSAPTLPDLLAAFRAIVDSLSRYWDKPTEASRTARFTALITEIDQFPGHTWRLAKLRQQAGVSAPTFLKWFRKTAGMPFGAYLRKARLSRAKDLLREGHLPLERIAQECGFGSACSFIQFFRKSQGMTPGCFRRSGASGH